MGNETAANTEKASLFYCDGEALRQFTTNVFQAFGLEPEAAGIVADNLVHADLRGHGSHGVTRIPIYTERLAKGVVNVAPNIQVERKSASVALVDADNGMGAVAGDLAIKTAIEIAKESGVGIASVRHSNHNGPGSFYVTQAAAQGLIGVSASNSPISMAVWGSRGRALGTNPLSVAIPAGSIPSIVMDMSSSVVARGKIVEAAKRGDPIPEGWALDTKGKPTTDSKAAEAGVVLPFAGAKGSAIAILVDMLAGVLSGAAYSKLVNNLYADFENAQNNGQFTMAVDVSMFMPKDAFIERVENFIKLMKATALADGVDEILMPGEPELRNELKFAKIGVPLPVNVIEDIRTVADSVGIEMPDFASAPLG